MNVLRVIRILLSAYLLIFKERQHLKLLRQEHFSRPPDNVLSCPQTIMSIAESELKEAPKKRKPFRSYILFIYKIKLNKLKYNL